MFLKTFEAENILCSNKILFHILSTLPNLIVSGGSHIVLEGGHLHEVQDKSAVCKFTYGRIHHAVCDRSASSA